MIKYPGLTVLIVLLSVIPRLSRAGGEEVAVVYNTEQPESRQVAEHYAALRKVPAEQVFGLALTTNEIMSRSEFTDTLQKPLTDLLEKKGIWRFGQVTIRGTNGAAVRVDERVVASTIRYAVLCYGVPLKIAPDMNLQEIEAKLMRSELQRNEASVDSELAWLPLSRVNVPLTGPLPNGYYLCTNHLALNPTNGILLVARLDGPNAQIASNLVDKAMAAERDGLWGRAYFDARGLAKTNEYYLGDQWMTEGAEICRRLGFDTTTDTNEATWSASFPMDHIGIYAGWYANDAAGPFAQPTVEFMTGAFAYHLHSFSANTLRSTTANWCGPLLAKGAACTMGCVYEPYLMATPNIAFFLNSWAMGFTFGEAAWASQVALSWQTTVIGDPLYQPFATAPVVMHSTLARENSPLIEWSFNRLINLDIVHGAPLAALEKFAKSIPVTAHSAVLTEKLAELEYAQNEIGPSIDDWTKALDRNPSPEQSIRIRLKLADVLVQQNRKAEALTVYRELALATPGYPGLSFIRDRVKLLQPKSPIP
jgi:uncharacterized protein (TIGR03790 family)